MPKCFGTGSLGSKTILMKVISELNLKKTPASYIKNPVLTFFSLSLLVLLLFVLLTACDDRHTAETAKTAVPGSPTTITTNTPAVHATTGNQSAFSNNQDPAITSQTSPGSEETFSSQIAGQPSITFSPQIVEIGQDVEVSGEGYPANTRLNIRLSSADSKSDSLYGSVLTDQTGAFKTTLKLENSSITNLLTPGKVEIAVTTTDSRIGASAPLALQPASNASQDEACKNLVVEFFATLKRDSGAAQVYLSTDLRSRIAGGKTSLNDLLGTKNPPLRVEVTGEKEGTETYQATMFFSGGEQKSVALDVATDISGALKISAIRAK